VAEINYLAVLVAAILNMALGALWYSPAVFGKAWMELVGFKPEDAQKRMAGMQRAYSLTFVASFVMAYALARVLWYAKVDSMGAGIMIGLLAWIGFVAATHGSNYLFEGKPFRLFTINAGYYLVALVIMGALLAVWR
jgi:surface polysaccharide O-acyltransferase-like enzyme